MGIFRFLKKEKAGGEPETATETKQTDIGPAPEPEEAGEIDLSRISWPERPSINPLKVSNQQTGDVGELPESAVIEDDRRDEVGTMLFSGKLNPDTLRFLSLQELLLAMTALEAWQGQDLLPQPEEQKRKLFNEVINRIRDAKQMFVLYDLATGYPFIESGSALMYLEQEKAAYAVKLYGTQNRMLAIRQVTGEGGEEAEGGSRTFFDYLYFLGIGYCILDNGLYRVRFARTQIVAEPGDWGEQKGRLPDNGPAVYAMLEFLQELRWRVGYAQRAEVLKAKEERMIQLLKQARFIVPTKPEGPTEVLDNGLIRVDNRTRVQFPMMQGPNGEQFQPVFTDGIEFAKRFAGGGWLGGVYTMEGLSKIATDKTGIVVNPDGERLLLNMEHLKPEEKG